MVLLILAGVSIRLVLSDNGIISKAKQAKLKTEKEHVREKVLGSVLEFTIDSAVNGKEVTEKASIEEGSETLYVKFSAKIEGGKITEIRKDTKDGATGYSNGVYALNDICEQLYSNKAKGITARSINLADMEKNLTPDGFTARNNYKDAVQYGTTKTYTEGNSYYPNYYKNEIGSGVDVAEDKANTITQPDITNAVDPYKESEYSRTLTSGYTQAPTKNLTVTQTHYSISINSTNYGAASSVLSNSNCYWVASRFVYAYSSLTLFGLRNAYTKMNYGILLRSDRSLRTSDSCRLRAIVSLESSDLTEKLE